LKKKRSKLQIAKEKAWKEFSIFVRTRESNFEGYTKCFTCTKVDHWKNMNAGHYKHGKLDFDEMNVNVQCVQCNKWNSGRLDVYTMNLIAKYGIDQVEALNVRASMATTEKYPIEVYEQIIAKYKALNKEKC